MDYKTVCGLLSVIIGLAAYWFYFRDIFANKTKPHTYSWLIWGLLSAVGFFGQLKGNAGAGAWVLGITTVANLLIFIVAIFKGQRHFSKTDKLMLAVALLAIVLLVSVKDPRFSVTLACGASIVAYYLTIKKSYYKPSEETVRTFALNSLKFAPSLFALQTFSYLTAIYPLTAMLGNAVLVGAIISRRRTLAAGR